MKLVIGIDLGGTHLSAALVTPTGQIKRKKTISFSHPPNGVKGFSLIKQLINSLSHNSSLITHHSVIGIGLAIPGSVDAERGIVLADSPNLIGWKGTNIKRPLEKIFKVPVLADNDANLAAWGEKQWGAGKGTQNLICLTIGTGVGGGIIIDNRIYRGSYWYAGEIGHTTILADGPICSCGKRGHLEALVSGPAIIRQYNIKTLKHYNNSDAKEIFNKAKRGDKTAQEVVRQTAHYLGIAIASLINIFDPEVVVVGGGVAKSGDILFNPLREVVKNNIMPHPYRKPQILPARLGENAGLLGAVALVFVENRDCPNTDYNRVETLNGVR